MPFTLLTAERMESKIRNSLVSLIQAKTDEKCVVNFEMIKTHLSEPRKTQAAFLLNIIELTIRSSDDDRSKASILSAAVYYVYKEINSTYCLRQSVHSRFFTLLEKALELSQANSPTSQNIIDMYASLTLFLQKQVYNSGLSQMGYNEAFSFQAVDKNYVVGVITNLLKYSAELKIQAIQQELNAELRSMENADQSKTTVSVASTYHLLCHALFEPKKTIDSSSSQEEKPATAAHK